MALIIHVDRMFEAIAHLLTRLFVDLTDLLCSPLAAWARRSQRTSPVSDDLGAFFVLRSPSRFWLLPDGKSPLQAPTPTGRPAE